ncbi:hypothetical protein A5766_04450 [Gordonia sp. 852002-51296_SCH5728562-b]|nr:hypothetical protein A5766_04450 [Gordonia sp. 852002-51296_SCH5728562-b]
MKPVRTPLDRLRELIEASRPECEHCAAKAVLRLTYTENYWRRTLWGEVYVCADHADAEAAYRRAHGMVQEIKWL